MSFVTHVCCITVIGGRNPKRGVWLDDDNWQCLNCPLQHLGDTRFCSGYPDWCDGGVWPDNSRARSYSGQKPQSASSREVTTSSTVRTSSSSSSSASSSVFQSSSSSSSSSVVVSSSTNVGWNRVHEMDEEQPHGDGDDPIEFTAPEVPRSPPVLVNKKKRPILKTIIHKGFSVNVHKLYSEDPGDYRFNYTFFDIHENWHGPSLEAVFEEIERIGYHRFQYVDPYNDPRFKEKGKTFPWLRIRKSPLVACHGGRYYSVRYELTNDAEPIAASRTLGFKDGPCVGSRLWNEWRSAHPDTEWRGTEIRKGVIVNHTDVFLDGLANLWFANNYSGLVDPTSGRVFTSHHNNASNKLEHFQTIPKHPLGGRVRFFTTKPIPPFAPICCAYGRGYEYNLGSEVPSPFPIENPVVRPQVTDNVSDDGVLESENNGDNATSDYENQQQLPLSPASFEEHDSSSVDENTARGMHSPVPSDQMSADDIATVVETRSTSSSVSSDRTLVDDANGLDEVQTPSASLNELDMEAAARAYDGASQLMLGTRELPSPPPSPVPSDEARSFWSEESPPVDTDQLYSLRLAQLEYERDAAVATLGDVEFVATYQQEEDEDDNDESLSDQWIHRANILEEDEKIAELSQSQDY